MIVKMFRVFVRSWFWCWWIVTVLVVCCFVICVTVWKDFRNVSCILLSCCYWCSIRRLLKFSVLWVYVKVWKIVFAICFIWSVFIRNLKVIMLFGGILICVLSGWWVIWLVIVFRKCWWFVLKLLLCCNWSRYCVNVKVFALRCFTKVCWLLNVIVLLFGLLKKISVYRYCCV